MSEIRLRNVLNAYNEKPHTIQGMTSRRRAGQIMAVEWRQGRQGLQPGMDFSSFQERSMNMNGYQRRSIQSIHFQTQDSTSTKSFGPRIGTQASDPYWQNLNTEMSFRHGNDESVSLTDFYMTDVEGMKRRWLCIEISRPLVDIHGAAPCELDPMPQSSIKIAVPADKVTVLPSPWQSQAPGDVASNSLRLEYSKDGIALFVTQSKADYIPGHNFVEDFFSAAAVTGLPWKESDRRLKAETVSKRKHEFWERVQRAANEDRMRWISLQKAMARKNCVVDIIFRSDWLNVAPSAPGQQLWTQTDPRLLSSVPAQIPRRSYGSNGRPDARFAGHTNHRPPSSGLRNELKCGERQTGRKAQMSNIAAAKTVADIIRSCLGPKAMLKMLLDPMGGIVLTNDGHAILREIEVSHPAAKSMIELSRTQDEEVGDGTTTVIIMAGEILAQSLPQLERNIHPVQIIAAFRRALKDALEIVDDISLPIDVNDDKAMRGLISSSIGTKFVSRWSDLMCDLALRAVRTVTWEVGNGKTEVDIKRYARVEKVPGGEIEDSQVLDGVMLNKDITHPKMRRRIENPRIILLDCPLEYKKGESQTNIEISKEEDWNRILEIEEEQVKAMCESVLAHKPDLVITEKGVSDLAQHYLLKANVTAIRRVRKTDNNRIARATGATIVNRVDDIQDSDVGTLCGLFEIEKIGDEYFTFLTKCQNPKACTVLLRGPSKDVLNEIERNLQDAMGVARNVMFNPRLAPGGGATEMAVAVRLSQLAKSVEGVQQWPYKAVADALEVIPRTLVQNAGASPVRVLTDLRAKHAEGKHSWGINGDSGVIADMKEYGVWEPEAIKLQSIKTAIEAACLLLRVDDICSARKAAQMGNGLHGGGDE
ncbi:hypothetical protein CkaCkLH20_12401 [Colletotrichum karsti]|uniref:T-complex protein 1 subunit gamma n=1 Tax=Colletotrichum karsti TaxID=1095194 RepID=A0A9P6LFC1_9PEZI|nr:uncharacterized protein CkaCkLH20_12401 [Colletotrichum karsti]KAF9870167.1 hypothetical protein CkaCkLH20_12401 [Colletotrichum karsti]